MSLSTVLEFNKPDKMKTNNILLEIARKVVNSSPEPRYKIKLRDEILAMKEKERLGFNFNRSVTASLKSRWDVVEKATKDYLQEIYDMNDQIEEDGRKYENQLINLIITRTTNLGLNSRIEQMAGLFMHMNFYCTVLKFKIQHLEPARAFMFTCSDLLGFSRPSQLVDRYAALQHVFTELYVDYEARQNLLNHLTETLSEVKAETNHRNMLMHNQMAEMHSRIKHLQTESAQLERAIIDQMESSTGASLEIYKIKNAVFNIYIAMMNYRGLEPTHTDSFGQLEELEVRVSHTQAAVKMLQMEEAKRQSKKKLHKKAETEEAQYEGDAFSDKTSDYGSDTRLHKSVDTKVSFFDNANYSANESNSNTGGLYVNVARRMSKKDKAVKSLTLPRDVGLVPQRRMPLPPIVAKESPAVNHKEKLQPQGTLLLPKLDTSSNQTAKLQQKLKMKPESFIGITKTGSSGVQESERSTASVPQVSSISCSSGLVDRPGKISGSVSYPQPRVRRNIAKNSRVISRSVVNKIHPQNKFRPQISEVSSELKPEIKFDDEEETNASSIFLTDIPQCEYGSVLDTIYENTDENVNATTERKSRSRSSTVERKNDTRICCTNVLSRSNSLKERSFRRVRMLNEIASRRNLKDNCLNILAKVKP